MESPPHVPLRYRLIGAVVVVSALILGVVFWLHYGEGIAVSRLTQDIVTTGGMPVYTGFLSQVGIFFWAASATLCLFGVVMLAGSRAHHRFRRFLLVAGLLTLFLGLDDAFLLHELVLPHFGIPQLLVLGSYAAGMLFFLIAFRSLILETEYILLGVALFFFATSVFLDVVNLPSADIRTLLEDSAKMIGLVSWLAYFFWVARYAVNARRHEPQDDAHQGTATRKSPPVIA